MKWLWSSLIIIIVIIFSKLLNNADYTNQKNSSESLIIQPYWYKYVAFFGFTVFNLASLIFIINQNEWLSALMTTSISLLYIPIYLFAKNWKIEFDEHSFSFTNMWKIKKYYEYADVTFIDTGRALRIYHKNKKIVAISALIVNVDKLEKQYNLFKKRNKNLNKKEALK